MILNIQQRTIGNPILWTGESGIVPQFGERIVIDSKTYQVDRVEYKPETDAATVHVRVYARSGRSALPPCTLPPLDN